MKMVKSLLLGSAAGLVAVAGAQAADLPVKAKPVQYVKICSLYGAGFYYIPGTDMCLKVGGWVRAEYAWGNNGSSTTSQIGNVNNRNTNNMWWRHRGYITADARNQTEYGTVRSYIAVGVSSNSTAFLGDNAANTFDANRAFIQWAGFTFGRTTSFFDFYSAPAVGYAGMAPGSDVGDGGIMVAAYTAQFGNGFSATIGAEMRRVVGIINSGSVAATGINALNANFSTAGSTAAAFGSYGGFQSPDIVGNLRVDQAWGSAQLMGALHQVNGGYYANSAGTTTGIENNGHPSDKWGFAIGAGLRLNAPMIGAGDYFQSQVNYTQGALKYVYANPSSGPWYMQRGQNAGFGIMSDAVYGGAVSTGTASSAELTTAWNVNASYEHFWNRQWRTSVYGGYSATTYNTSANAMLCSQIGSGNGTGAGTGAVATAGCDMNWQSYWVGSRTQWNITPDFYMGLDVIYLNLQTASTASGTLPATLIPASTGTTGQVVGDQGIWSVRFRVHKDFYP